MAAIPGIGAMRPGAVCTFWMIPPTTPPVRLLLVMLLAAAVVGCDRDDEIRTYTVAKPAEPATGTAAHSPDDGHDHAAEARPEAELAWAVPEGWRRVPGDRPMRVATFEAGEATAPVEVVVSVFPGDTGGLLANVNRWRGQVGLAPITDAELASQVEAFTADGMQGHTMRLQGNEMHLLGAAIFEPGADRTWFVKAIAPPQVADALEPQVNAFARSFSRRGDGAGEEGA